MRQKKYFLQFENGVCPRPYRDVPCVGVNAFSELISSHCDLGSLCPRPSVSLWKKNEALSVCEGSSVIRCSYGRRVRASGLDLKITRTSLAGGSEPFYQVSSHLVFTHPNSCGGQGEPQIEIHAFIGE